MSDAWQQYPDYRIDVVPCAGIGRAIVAGRLIAESTHCLFVRESDHRVQLYFPIEDVRDLTPAEQHTTCPFKGVADWFDVAGLANAAWTYPTPDARVAGIAGHLCFETDDVTVTAAIPFEDGTEAVVHMPMWGTAAELAHLMDAVPEGEGIFTLPTYPEPPLGTFVDLPWHHQRRNVIEGGQLLGAAIVAAAKTRPDQRITSAHMAFLKAASFDEPVRVQLDTQRSGATLSAFGVKLEQAGKLRASGIVMADTATDDLIRHVGPMPDVPPPSQCPSHDFGVLGRETRFVEGAYSSDIVGPPELFTWTRFTENPGPQYLHQALLAQATTHYSIAAALRVHDGFSEDDAHRTLSMGPVNSTVAFHDEVDVTQWLLTETRSIWAGRGSCQSQVRVFTQDGQLVASKTVQALIRAFAISPEQMGQDFSSAM